MCKRHIKKFIIKNNYYLPKPNNNIPHPTNLIFEKWAKEKAKKYPEVAHWQKLQNKKN
jgi:hypothetical protein